MADDPNQRSHPYVAAGALIFDHAHRLMLVRPTYKEGWDIPGGYVEVGETPRQTCLRELKEELGIDVTVGELLVVDWAPHPAEGDKLLFVFDGGTLSSEQTAAIQLQADELAEYAFHDVSEAAGLLVPRLARRIVAAARAHRAGQPRYLEDGLSVEVQA